MRSKLSAIDLLGKYRDYYKSVDRDIRVIIESAQPASISVDDGVVGVIPDGGEMSKDEIVGVLSGVIMDGRVDVRSKLSAIELLGKYRDRDGQGQVEQEELVVC